MKKKGRLLIYTGLMLIAAALCLCGYNLLMDYNAGRSSEAVMEALAKDSVNPVQMTDDNIRRYDELNMAVKTVDGVEYCGTLIFPNQNHELPVADKYDYGQLDTSLVRYMGTVYNNDLIICGHNTDSHLRVLYALSEGDPVIFRDVFGYDYHYEVLTQEFIAPTGVEDMLNGEWDMTLFTCTFDNTQRMTIRLKRVN